MRLRSQWLGVAAVLATCALGACRSTYKTDPVQLSTSAVVLEMPIVAQDELYECGLVSISSLCLFYGVDIPESQRLQLVKTAAESHGLSGNELKETLEKLGFDVFLFTGTLDEAPTGLKHHVDQGRPAMVMTAASGENHYVLFIGYDDELDSVVLIDPRRGRVVLPSPAFLRLWEPTSRFTLLAVPPSGSGAPTSASPAPTKRS